MFGVNVVLLNFDVHIQNYGYCFNLSFGFIQKCLIQSIIKGVRHCVLLTTSALRTHTHTHSTIVGLTQSISLPYTTQ